MNSEERTLTALYALELGLELDVDELVELGLGIEELERIRRGRALLEYQRELALEQARAR